MLSSYYLGVLREPPEGQTWEGTCLRGHGDPGPPGTLHPLYAQPWSRGIQLVQGATSAPFLLLYHTSRARPGSFQRLLSPRGQLPESSPSPALGPVPRKPCWPPRPKLSARSVAEAPVYPEEACGLATRALH